VAGLVVTSAAIYASYQNSFYSAALGNYGTFSNMPAPAANTDFAAFLAYDESRHILYASCWGGGLFRFVDQ
jgi:hypothetical protein